MALTELSDEPQVYKGQMDILSPKLIKENAQISQVIPTENVIYGRAIGISWTKMISFQEIIEKHEVSTTCKYLLVVHFPIVQEQYTTPTSILLTHGELARQQSPRPTLSIIIPNTRPPPPPAPPVRKQRMCHFEPLHTEVGRLNPACNLHMWAYSPDCNTHLQRVPHPQPTWECQPRPD